MQDGGDDLPDGLGVLEGETERLHGVHDDAVILLVVYTGHLVGKT